MVLNRFGSIIAICVLIEVISILKFIILVTEALLQQQAYGPCLPTTGPFWVNYGVSWLNQRVVYYLGSFGHSMTLSLWLKDGYNWLIPLCCFWLCSKSEGVELGWNTTVFFSETCLLLNSSTKKTCQFLVSQPVVYHSPIHRK